MTSAWINWIGTHFTPEHYMFWSRIQGTAWTAADFVIVFYALRIANLCRRLGSSRLHRFSYIVLALTLPFALLIPFVPTPTAFFRLELIVTVPHFLIIIYVMLFDAHIFLNALRKLTTNLP